ncbi:hypothetical protein BGZ70_006063, partial [Mortierella alpina]
MSVMSGYKSTGEGASVSGSTVVPGREDGLSMRSQWKQHSKSTGHHTTPTTSTEKSPAVTAAHRGSKSGRAATFLKQAAASMALNIGSSGSLPSPTRGSYQSGSGANSPAQRRRRANLLRVWIERGLMVGMGLLAGYRMMTLKYNREPLQYGVPSSGSPLKLSGGSWHSAHEQAHKDVIPTLSKNAWAIGAGLVLLTLVHALFLTAHDHRLQFPLYNKNQPLQPVQKRSSRYLNINAPQAVAAAAVVADSDDDSDDDEALQRERAAELQENLQLLNQESVQGASGNGAAVTGSGGGGVMEPVLGSLQSRFCQSAEGAMPQWRVWGSEAHWYRKGADNGSIFATVLVPVVLAAKFVQTVKDERFLSTATDGIETAESVLSSLALSLTFGASILVHMLLLKVFEDHAGHGPKTKPSPLYKDASSRSTILDSITLPPSTTPSATPSSSMSTNNLHASAA